MLARGSRCGGGGAGDGCRLGKSLTSTALAAASSAALAASAALLAMSCLAESEAALVICSAGPGSQERLHALFKESFMGIHSHGRARRAAPASWQMSFDSGASARGVAQSYGTDIGHGRSCRS